MAILFNMPLATRLLAVVVSVAGLGEYMRTPYIRQGGASTHLYRLALRDPFGATG